MLDIALGMLLGAYLIWWVFVKHDPRKFRFGVGNFERDRDDTNQEDENQ